MKGYKTGGRQQGTPNKISAKIKDRATGKTTTEHYYLKCMTLHELNDYIESSSAKKKVIRKCKNEIARREK